MGRKIIRSFRRQEMVAKLPALALMVCGFPLVAAAGNSAIGTASTWGDMRVDGYRVQGDATLFDGSILETG